MHTDVNACDCTKGCEDTVGDSALKVDWEKNSFPHWGIGPVQAACQSDALLIAIQGVCVENHATRLVKECVNSNLVTICMCAGGEVRVLFWSV